MKTNDFVYQNDKVEPRLVYHFDKLTDPIMSCQMRFLLERPIINDLSIYMQWGLLLAWVLRNKNSVAKSVTN